ncbi:MAG: hypothetical protein AAFR87_18605 [Bacteroidota bacterium]
MNREILPKERKTEPVQKGPDAELFIYLALAAASVFLLIISFS